MLDNSSKIIELISQICSISRRSVEAVVALLSEGATIPFISRYRKEATGSLDEVQVGAIKQHYDRLKELLVRRETILSTIEQQGKLTDELRVKIEQCYDLSQLEDMYLPYKPKRRTRATIAREKGLEPLAAMLVRQDGSAVEVMAKRFVKDEVASVEDALNGASDIIAEWVSESERSRAAMRRLFSFEGEITSKLVKGKEIDGAKFSDYFDSSELIRKTPSHRVLAMVRGEREGFLRINVAPDAEKAVEQLSKIFVKGNSPARKIVEQAVEDSYKRLLRPSMESEIVSAAKERADVEAIAVFAENLRQLLLSSPLGQKRVLAIDPGFRTGCKVVCLGAQGELIHNTTIYPHPPQSQFLPSQKELSDLVAKYKINAIAIGDGTAGRETEQLVKSIGFPADIQVFMVSEDGASVYSASAVAREEFPDYDVTVRGSVSIGRRLIDPLAELVKIDPKAIGVGQYQHDVDQTKLKASLDITVESCVNNVGVNLNTASVHLLAYVSGLGASLARNIVEYRSANGAFTSRKELLKVPRLGAKAFEQCAGFLRIDSAKNPLDNSAVHPEAYGVVECMASDLGVSVAQLLAQKELQQKVDLSRYVSDKIGLPTLQDIMKELEKPGRDPRGEITEFSFAEGVHTVSDLYEGMTLPGIVTNITAFGAFVDVGVKQDGLVHISQLANKYVSNPADVVKLHQHVTVRVLSIDRLRNRIGLTLK